MEESTSCSKREKDESCKELRDEFLSKTKSEFRDEVLSNESSQTGHMANIKSIENKLMSAPNLLVYGKELKVRTTIDAEFMKKSQKELRETPEVVTEALEVIRELVKGITMFYFSFPFEKDNYLPLNIVCIIMEIIRNILQLLIRS